jgi:hypothetical protein
MIQARRPILCCLTSHLWGACPRPTLCATASLAAGRRPWGMRTSARAATTAPQGRWRVREGGKLRVDRDRSGTVGGDFVTPHRRPQRDSQDSLTRKRHAGVRCALALGSNAVGRHRRGQCRIRARAELRAAGLCGISSWGTPVRVRNLQVPGPPPVEQLANLVLDILCDHRCRLADPSARVLPRTECGRACWRHVVTRDARLRLSAIAGWHQVNPP